MNRICQHVFCDVRCAICGDIPHTIEVDKERASGRPVLRGTRFPLAQLLAELGSFSEGRALTADNIADDYDLPRDIVRAALRELADILASGAIRG